LIERLSERGVVWAAEVVLNIPEYLTGALGVMDTWLGADQILPTGGMLPPCSLDELAELGKDARRMLKRHTQALQMRNSFGVGVFVGNFLMVLAEDDADEEFGVQMSLRDALTTLGGVTLGPLDLMDTGDLPWAERMEGQLLDLRQRTELGRALIPIVRRHGFLVRRMALLTRRQMTNAQRSMFLAGLMAVGLELRDLVEEWKGISGGQPCAREDPEGELGAPLVSGPADEARMEVAGQMDLFFRTDEELARLMCDEALREPVREELEFRLRTNRLNRMLAHLKRTTRGEAAKGEGADGE